MTDSYYTYFQFFTRLLTILYHLCLAYMYIALHSSLVSLSYLLVPQVCYSTGYEPSIALINTKNLHLYILLHLYHLLTSMLLDLITLLLPCCPGVTLEVGS
ncbi:hypothetical protein BD413DRAFT_546108 [Trametes elegans]|nr:hypothetical protein BD413DRAFT_546108 [Trametes elegans]